MKKSLTLTFLSILLTVFVMAQSVSNLDIGPKGLKGNSSKGNWTVQFNHNFGRSASAGCETDGTNFYVTQWNSNLIWKLDLLGVVVDSFSIAGVSGLRDLAYDGTYFYGGASSDSIYKMDFTNKTLIATINSPNETVRNICYDPNADGGNGAFWVGNWSTDFSLVSRTGSVLSTITAASHGLKSTYGTAYDTISAGGPFIWAISAGDPANTTIFQINVSTGTQTGLTHDITSDVTTAGALGGGLWIEQGVVGSTVTIGGLIQGKSIFGYDLATTAASPYDMAMTSLDIPSVSIINQNTNIKGTIKNEGSEIITTYDLNYQVDNGSVITQNVTGANLASFQSSNFTHSTPYTATAGIHNISVWTSNLNGQNDQNTSNDTLSTTMIASNAVYARNVVYEEGTGTWCGWCVRGLVGLNTMAHNITDGSWIGIGVHNGNNDPMVVNAYDNAMRSFFSSYPSGTMDRHANDVDPGLTTLQAAYNAHKAMPSIAKIEVTNKSYNSSTRAWTCDVATTFGLDLTSANFNTALIIVENNVTGTSSGFAQANYYSGGGSGPMVDYDGRNYANLTNPVPAADMVYNHVGRELVDGFNGSANSIPSTITYNVANSFSYSGTLSANIEPWQTSFVAIIIDNATGQIVNATEVQFGNVGINNPTETKYSIYPNPTNGIVTIEGTKDAQIIVYNMIGEIIYTNDKSNENTTIDLSSFAAGNYIVKIISNDEVTTQKIVLTK